MANLWLSVDYVKNVTLCGQPLCDFATCSDDDIAFAIQCAQEAIECATCKTFCPEETTRLFSGACQCKLFLGCDTLRDIRSVTIVGEEGCCCSSGSEIKGYKNMGSYLDLCCGSGCCNCCGESCTVWPKGCDNIAITGVWGDEMPARIKKALYLLIQNEICGASSCSSDCSPAIDPRVKRIQWPDFDVEYDTEDLNVIFAGQGTGIYEVDMLLKDFVPSPLETMFVIPREGTQKTTWRCP